MEATASYSFYRMIYGEPDEKFGPPCEIFEPGGQLIPERLEELCARARVEDRGVLPVLARHITSVAYNQFLSALKGAAAPIRELLPESVVLVDPGKSGMWVAQLASKELRAVGGVYMAHGSETIIKRGLQEYRKDGLEEDVAAWRKLNNVIVFDDASYSGRQLVDAIRTVHDVFTEEIGTAPFFHIVVPYISRRAFVKLHKLEAEEGISLHVYFSEYIDTVAEVVGGLSQEEKAEISSMTPDEAAKVPIKEVERRVDAALSEDSFLQSSFEGCLFVPPFKVPDRFSFPARLPSVLKEVEPPYKIKRAQPVIFE